jgi:archaellum component FlaC
VSEGRARHEALEDDLSSLEGTVKSLTATLQKKEEDVCELEAHVANLELEKVQTEAFFQVMCCTSRLVAWCGLTEVVWVQEQVDRLQDELEQADDVRVPCLGDLSPCDHLGPDLRAFALPLPARYRRSSRAACRS